MWEEYRGKKILVTPFDRGNEFGGYQPIEFLVIKILNIQLNTVVLVLTNDCVLEWIYPAEYTVMDSVEVTNEADTWHQYIGKNILTVQRYRGSIMGGPKELIVIRTRGAYAMVCDLSIRQDGKYVTCWKDTTELDVVGVL
jgi:hypothetical protein